MKKLTLNGAALDMTASDISKYRDILENTFPHHKVSKLSQGHRLRQLWTREDWLADIELLTLAHAIETMSTVDKRWTKKHIDKIVGKDANELIGSIFELHCATMLFDAELKPIPGKNNSPGYDLELVYPDSFKNFVSLKNHDLSSFETEFRKKCRRFKESMESIFELKGEHPFVMIEASRLPNEDDWSALEKHLAGISTLGEDFVIEQPREGIAIGYNLLRPKPGTTFAAKPISSQLMVKSKFHDNEQNNFVSKLEKAAHNMRDKLNRQEKASNIVCMRVNPTASVEYLELFAKEFLESEHDHGIDGVIFYQPSVIRNPDNSSVVSHYTRVIGSSRWDQSKHPINFRPFIGVPGRGPSRLVMQGDGKSLLENIEAYFFQEGDYYQQFQLQEGTQNLSNPAPGIRSHLAIGDGSALSGKLFAKQEDLLLL